MALHVAILQEPYLSLILQGRKSVESRLTIQHRPPYRQISRGDRIYFKRSAGPFVATGVAGQIDFYENLTPAEVARLAAKYNDRVCGHGAYWAYKRDARYATFIELGEIEPVPFGPPFAKSQGPAWFVLDDHLDPRVVVTLTAGAIRNGYVPLPRTRCEFPEACYGGPTAAERGRPITLHMPDGQVVTTDIVARSGMVRWRGWKRYFDAGRVQPGHRVRFMRSGPTSAHVALLQ